VAAANVLSSMLLLIDEHLPDHEVRQFLFGHGIEVADLGTNDPAVIKATEADDAIIVTSDHWFYSQLRRVA
jgi:predicted nuclease of predicted toxin-antitoxin system